LRYRSVHIRLRDPPLASDALVNQRLAVGGERGDLGFQVSSHPPGFQDDAFNVLGYPDLFFEWRKWQPKKFNSIYSQPWLRCCIGVLIEIHDSEQFSKPQSVVFSEQGYDYRMLCCPEFTIGVVDITA